MNFGGPTPKHEVKKINKQSLWMVHESLQKEFAPINEWYKMNTDVIENLDYERQKIVRKYFQFKDGVLHVNQQQQYVLNKGMNMQDYDREMEALMTGEVDIKDNGAIKWPITVPASVMKVVE